MTPVDALLAAAVAEPVLAPWENALRAAVDTRYRARRFGDEPDWQQALTALPDVTPSTVALDRDTVTVGRPSDLTDEARAALAETLMRLHPWRKGPFNLFGVLIDTEWRSDWKWQRLRPHIRSLAGRAVLDVGCGSGYHLWRMAGDGASLVLGVDPTLKFLYQFLAVRRFVPEPPVYCLPLRDEDLPRPLSCFDTVFSLGVIYHRQHPDTHLAELFDALRPGGEVVLESLVIEDDRDTALVPDGRYARMRNVWEVPSPARLQRRLAEAGFTHARVVDVTPTTPDEQRRTPWMTFHSLSDFLDPTDPSRTVEGHPAPVRATLIAQRPD